MLADWSKVRIAVLGGDDREVIVARTFVELGAHVVTIGLPDGDEMPGAHPVANLSEAVAGRDILIGPVQGIDARFTIVARYALTPLVIDDKVIARIQPGCLFFVGKAPSLLAEAVARRGVRLVEFRDRDDFAILNSIPTAEGALQLAMNEMDITIHSCSAWVLGFGRTGQTMVHRLLGMGARTTVVARQAADRARALELGCRSLSFVDFPEGIEQADVVFNTVPEVILTEPVLSRLKRGAVIIDLASAPGGTDFTAARELGIRALLAPGLPGKVAPRSAGNIVASVLLQLIAEYWPQGGARSTGGGEDE